ncbi:DNA-binding protein [Gordonia hydrophobica]|uniref:DNA-binding protein n=1 Tax=Gordonia hydrophobica TaxID=40516 RepID=A0ABZ2U1A8_9ACTN|nr:DNA-binding protein [Gordonia hydrophobica]MBM7368466.1 hypothetical protein [Gordonia hydrophobica]
MERRHDLAGADHADRVQARREHDAQDRILAMGADQLDARPWRPAPAPPTAADLVHYALWRAADLTPAELLSALGLIRAAKAEIEGVESGLLFVARSEGLTWAQIADVMGFRSPQACQQYVQRLTARQDKQR